MDENEPSKYIAKIVLEILDRLVLFDTFYTYNCKSYSRPRLCFYQRQVHRREKFNIEKFNPKEAACTFLKQHNGETFVRAQKVKSCSFYFML